ncbi:MAG: periplasmic heavy metal sensor [Bacteroidales bacterium]|nr:periplasmic heavy metal sensor [Bacteroidales bacterium]MBK9356534.1 periplasmic heavy metal sensor [Bacteroidales bacterium]
MIQNRRTRVLLFIITALTIINLAAVATIIYHVRKYHQSPTGDFPAMGESGSETPGKPSGPGFLFRELGFDKDQRDAFHQSRLEFRRKALPLFSEIKKLNNELADEIIIKNPDTLKLQAISRKIGEIHANLKLLTIHHMREVKSIATPDQQEKLGLFYRDLLSRDAGPPGKGMQYRYRHGAKNN